MIDQATSLIERASAVMTCGLLRPSRRLGAPHVFALRLRPSCLAIVMRRCGNASRRSPRTSISSAREQCGWRSRCRRRRPTHPVCGSRRLLQLGIGGDQSRPAPCPCRHRSQAAHQVSRRLSWLARLRRRTVARAGDRQVRSYQRRHPRGRRSSHHCAALLWARGRRDYLNANPARLRRSSIEPIAHNMGSVIASVTDPAAPGSFSRQPGRLP